MKAKILFPLALLVVIAALVFGYVEMSKERAADEAADQPITAASRVHSGTNGETTVNLDNRTKQLIGLETVPLAAADAPAQMKAYGQVLDSVAVVAAANDAAAARAAWQASRPEYERLKKLSAQDNASAHALEAAAAQMKHDQGALETAQAQLVAASSEALLTESAAFFQALARRENVLVRLDLPVAEIPAAAPTAAQLLLPGTSPPVAVRFLGCAATADPQVQGIGYIFVVSNAPPALAPGLAVAGFLVFSAMPARGVIVPDAAVVRSDGRAWIYVQTGDTNFTRREISLEQPAPGGWFVTNSVAPGDKVVVTGAQMLLSEEHKSEIKLED